MHRKFQNQSLLIACFAGLGFVLVAGCEPPNLAGVNAYKSATTPNFEQTYVMDPGSNGGIADASGGTRPGTSYGTGAPGKYDGDKGHYERMSALRPRGYVNWSTASPSTNHPLPNGVGN